MWEFPLQQEESIVLIDGLSDAHAAGCPKTRRSTSGGCLLFGQHTLSTWSSTHKVVSLSSAELKCYSMVRCASEAIGQANTTRELGHEAQVRIWTDAAAARGLALRRGSGAIKHMETTYFSLQQKEKNQELRVEKIRGTVNPADLMTKHQDGQRLVMLCELFSIKRIDGRPSSAPKLTIDTEYISRASRALAAVTLVKRATTSEIAVHSGAMQETWIDGYRTDCWTVTGWMLGGIVTCCILMALVMLWRKTGRIVDMVDDETQTLEEGERDPEIPMRVMITKNGRAVHCRKDCPSFLKSFSIQTLSWCSHCDPRDALEKRTSRGRVG